jgi:hypothetical protein
MAQKLKELKKEEEIKEEETVEPPVKEEAEITPEEREITEISKELIDLARDLEEEKIGSNDELVTRLAKSLRKLEKRNKKKALSKLKKKQKSLFDKIAIMIMKTFVRKNREEKRLKDKMPGRLENAIMDSLEAQIRALKSASRIDSNINDVRLIGDVVAIREKMAALSGRLPMGSKGVSNLMFSARTAVASVSGRKDLASLSTLKTDLAGESWAESRELNYSAVSGRIEVNPEQESIANSLRSNQGKQSFGPSDVPTTKAAKERKEKRNEAFQSYTSPSDL